MECNVMMVVSVANLLVIDVVFVVVVKALITSAKEVVFSSASVC